MSFFIYDLCCIYWSYNYEKKDLSITNYSTKTLKLFKQKWMEFFLFIFFYFMTLSNLECLVLYIQFCHFRCNKKEILKNIFTLNLHLLRYIIEKMIKPSWTIWLKYRRHEDTTSNWPHYIRFKWTNRSKFYRSHKLINCHVAIENLLPIKWGTIS